MPSLKLPDLPSRTDILIVGAGPTGLALAAELRRQGIETVVVDKVAEGANTSRAAVVHARTLEVLEPLGVVPTMLAEGFKVPVFRVRDRDKALITIDFQQIPSSYAFTLMCPQDRTEAILLARLRALGGEVIRPVEALMPTNTFSQPANSVFVFRSITRPVGPSAGERDQVFSTFPLVRSISLMEFLSSIFT